MVRSLFPCALAAWILPVSCSSTPTRQVVESFIEASEGVLLHYRQLGSGGEVLLVPGGSWIGSDVDALIKGRKVVFYDLRGRGRSSALPANRPPTIEQDIADMETLRDWLDLERFAILAFDYQAAVAALYAERYPERVERLVLISPIPPRRSPYLDIYEAVYNTRVDRDTFRELFLMRQRYVNIRDPRAWAAAYRDALLSGWVVDEGSLARMRSNPFAEPNIDPERAIQQYMKLVGAMGDWDWRPDLARVSSPTLIIDGEADPMPHKSYAEWVATIPGAREHVVPRSGRLPWIEQPNDFFRAVDRFLSGR